MVRFILGLVIAVALLAALPERWQTVVLARAATLETQARHMISSGLGKR